jgi:hypothetical protein
MFRLDPIRSWVFDEEVKGFNHGGTQRTKEEVAGAKPYHESR